MKTTLTIIAIVGILFGSVNLYHRIECKKDYERIENFVTISHGELNEKFNLLEGNVIDKIDQLVSPNEARVLKLAIDEDFKKYKTRICEGDPHRSGKGIEEFDRNDSECL